MKIIKGQIVLEENEVVETISEDIRNQLIEQNTPLVKYVIDKHFKYSCAFEYEDLYGYGVLGLCKAARKYIYSTKNKFSTFAYKIIWGEIKNAIRDKAGVIGPRAERQKTNAMPPAPFSFYEDMGNARSRQNGDKGSYTIDEMFYVQMTTNDDYGCILDRMNIDKVFSYLEPSDRDIFNMYYLEDMSQRAISEVIGVSQVQISRRLTKIKSVFEYLKPVLV